MSDAASILLGRPLHSAIAIDIDRRTPVGPGDQLMRDRTRTLSTDIRQRAWRSVISGELVNALVRLNAAFRSCTVDAVERRNSIVTL